MRKATRAVLLLVALAAVWALGQQTPRAQAHANLVRSDPPANAVLAQPPTEVLLWFSEPVDARFSRIQVVDSGQRQWDNGDTHLHFDNTNLGITLKDGLPEGTYTVIWSALSTVDGHRTFGSFAFTVGSSAAPPGAVIPAELAGASGPPRALRVSASWLELAAVVGLVGAVAFHLLAARRALEAMEVDRERAEEGAATLARRSAIGLALLTLAASAFVLWVRAWEAAGTPGAWEAAGQLLSDSSYGRAFIVRLALLATVAYLAGILFRPGAEVGIYHWMLLGTAAAVPVTVSLSGHAPAQDPAALRVALDWAHLTAAGVWVGGLLQLALFLALVPSDGRSRPRLLAALVPRFSLVAIASVVAIAVTGLAQALLTLDSPSELVSSAYGRALLAKGAFFLPLLLLGAFNLLLVRPRLQSLARSALQAVRVWEWRLRRAVAAEIALATGIVAITAFLVNTSPPIGSGALAQSPGQQEPVGIDLRQRADDLMLTLLVNPGRAGPNWVQLYLVDTNGDPRPVQAVLVRWRYLDQDLGTVEEQLEPLHPPEHYILQTQQLSLPGRYQAQVIVRREGLLDTRATFEVRIAQ
ncbi:MAG: copper resistance protein CopC [Chloroflexota bacterium]|nr:copper resistance protein CopC [Chloroflexota bacterium]